MKTAILYTFSGTGNTLRAANMLAKELRAHGYRADVYEVTRDYDEIPDPNQYDLVGMGYPIHAFNTPQLFRDFARHLPDVQDQKQVFFFKTSGEPFSLNNASSYLVYKELVNKGYNPVMETHFLMPYNVMFRYEDGLAKQMVLYTAAMARATAIRLTQPGGPMPARGPVPGTCGAPLRFTLRHRALSCALRIQWLGAKWNVYHVSKKKCVGCKQCLERCPAGNIRCEDGKLKFDHSCAMCMRCVMYCPRDAITPGFLALWKVNGPYDFEALQADDSIACDYVSDETTGYFASFNKYYDRVDADLASLGIVSPRSALRVAQEQRESV